MEYYNGMYVIQPGDVINGKMGTAFLKLEGNNIPFSWAKTFDAKMTLNKSELPRLGSTSLMNRAMGWKGEGSCTMYYYNSIFAQIGDIFNRIGKMLTFDFVVTVSDPSSTMGAHAVQFMNCVFDEFPLAKFDITSDDPLEMDANFTFDDFTLLSVFQHPDVEVALPESLMQSLLQGN